MGDTLDGEDTVVSDEVDSQSTLSFTLAHNFNGSTDNGNIPCRAVESED